MQKKNPPLWREIQRKNFIHVKELAEFLELDEEKKAHLLNAPSFTLNLPRRLAEKMAKNCLDDPIFKQFVPLHKESIQTPGFLVDPVSDKSFQKEKKLLQKYAGRALLLTSSACGMHCRFCFRQNFPYETTPGFDNELELIRKDTSLREVILSGGDPLSLDDAVLGDLLSKLGEVEHIMRIRFHTRFPIGIPERIDESFLKLLSSQKKQIFFAPSINHPRELDRDVLKALQSLIRINVPVITQSVLLRGVNDNVETLKELFLRLGDHGILPYYIHDLDPVQGAAHFEVPRNEGLKIMKDIQASISGYLVPRYVKEIPGEKGKTLIVSP